MVTPEITKRLSHFDWICAKQNTDEGPVYSFTLRRFGEIAGGVSSGCPDGLIRKILDLLDSLDV